MLFKLLNNYLLISLCGVLYFLRLANGITTTTSATSTTLTTTTTTTTSFCICDPTVSPSHTPVIPGALSTGVLREDIALLHQSRELPVSDFPFKLIITHFPIRV